MEASVVGLVIAFVEVVVVMSVVLDGVGYVPKLKDRRASEFLFP